MRYLLLVVIMGWITGSLSCYADDRFQYEDLTFLRMEVPIYEEAPYTPQVMLEMSYASGEILNGDVWLRGAHKVDVYEIDLVFTKYPSDINSWRTNYFDLLDKRMKNLFNLDPNLHNPEIRWNMIEQTDCKDESAAKKMFHGFVIKYRPKRQRTVEEIRTPNELKAMISGYSVTRDRTVTEVLKRHPEWKDMLVVMDWTGSMYKHGAQLVHWHKVNHARNASKVKHFVFFNDGNHKKHWQKKVGKTGGVYRAKEIEVDEIVNTMLYVMKKGNGGDPPENDLEALLTGLQYLEGFGEVILIADNKSEVRDIELLAKIDHPVRIILCDVKGDIHPHYLQIAKATGGSIHTLKRDLAPKQAQED